MLFCGLWAGASQAATPNNQLKDLRGRMHRLQKDLSATQESRTGAEEALRQSERAISETNRLLHELDQQQQVVQADLDSLHERADATRQAIAQSQQDLAVLLRERYEQDTPQVWPLLLSGKDPEQATRLLDYLELLAQSRSQSVQALRANLQTLGQVTAQRQSKLQQLAQIQSRQAAQRKRLQGEMAVRAKLVGALTNKLSKQQRSLESMRRDEKHLSQLVEEIAQRIARRQEERSRQQVLEAKRQAQEAATNKRSENASPGRGKGSADSAPKDSPATPPALALIDKTPQAGYDGEGFGRLKGHLRLPLQGELLNRFGSPRTDTGLTWRGLFIRAPEGRHALAVGAGRVVFADWLRGFGNLLIVDHGSGYMSLYGNAQSLFVRVGDLVQAGTAVASAGNTGGNPESGLYFELRYQSKPFDPLAWVGRSE